MIEKSHQRRMPAEATSQEIAAILHPNARREAARIRDDRSVAYLGPDATKNEWRLALKAAREAVIDSARRGATITFAVLQVAAYGASGRKIAPRNHELFGAALNDYSVDGCLISAIVTASDTGKPMSGLIPLAQGLGIDKSISILRDDVFEQFRTRAAIVADAVGRWWAALLPHDAIEWEQLAGLTAIRCHHCRTVFGVDQGPIVAVVACYPDRLDWFSRDRESDIGLFAEVLSERRVFSCPDGHPVGLRLPQLLEPNVRLAVAEGRDSVDA
jgi:hypothetical protein